MACGLMKAIKEWISPLPDRSLPAMQIRMELLKVLMGVSISLERPSPRPFSLDPHYVCRFNVANVFLGCSLEEQSPKINVEKSWREDAE